MLLTKGDRLLYFYLISLTASLAFYLSSLDFLWQVFITISNVYLIIIYGHDRALHTFYRILNIGEFSIHASKVVIIYGLSALQLIALAFMNAESKSVIMFVTHFLSFYAILIFFDKPGWVKLLLFVTIFVGISILLSATPLFVSFISIFVLVTILLRNRINGQISRRKSYSI